MEKDSKLSTSRLFHYTYSKEKLISILKDGFQPAYSLEKLSLIKTNDLLKAISNELGTTIQEEDITDEFAIPMSCFCDIPLELVENHTKIYGNYALGMKKEWGERQAICPVIYVPENGETRYLFEMMLRHTHKLLPQLKRRQERINSIPLWKRNVSNEMLGIQLIQYIDAIINLIMYVKPYMGNYERPRINFKEENYKFYDEREWRYKPSSFLARGFLTKEEYEDEAFRKSSNGALGYITFETEDISDIIAPSNEIEILRDEILKIEKYETIDIKIIDSIENKI